MICTRLVLFQGASYIVPAILLKEGEHSIVPTGQVELYNKVLKFFLAR